MSIQITSLSELSSDKVKARAALLAQLLQESSPGLDAKRGALQELVVRPTAVLGEMTAEEIDRYNRARSLREIAADPGLADEELVDSVLSLYRLERRTGAQATGTVTIVLSAAINVTIRSGTIFTGNGLEFATNRVFTSQPTAGTAAASSDQVLVQIDTNRWAFNVEVTAVESGAAGRLSKDTAVVPSDLPQRFVKAYAAADFAGGEDTETNAELVQRINRGIAARGGSNRYNMDAMLLDQPAFAGVKSTSVIGYGDAEQLRNHTIWPGALGGRVDWYIRTQERVELKKLDVEATLLSKGSDNRGTWQFALGKDDAPGFYDVVKIVRKDSDETLGGYPITQETRGFDLNDELVDFDVANAVEAAFSPLSTAVIQFTDEDTNVSSLTVGDAADYSVTVRRMPLLRELQDFVAGRRIRHAAADVLVKGPVPCFVQLSFDINLRSDMDDPDVETIKNDLASLVNNYGFRGRLPAAAISAVIQSHLDSPASSGAIDMFGLIRRPDNTIKPIRSSEMLLIPDEPGRMVTARTVAFMLDPGDIGISLRYVDMPEI